MVTYTGKRLQIVVTERVVICKRLCQNTGKFLRFHEVPKDRVEDPDHFARRYLKGVEDLTDDEISVEET